MCARRSSADEISRYCKIKKTHFTFNFVFENRAVYELMWENTVQPDRPQMTTWRMRIACWIPEATNAHSKYVTLIAVSLQQQQLHERASKLRYRYIGSVVTSVIRSVYMN
jgi:hypothetical protein